MARGTLPSYAKWLALAVAIGAAATHRVELARLVNTAESKVKASLEEEAELARNPRKRNPAGAETPPAVAAAEAAVAAAPVAPPAPGAAPKSTAPTPPPEAPEAEIAVPAIRPSDPEPEFRRIFGVVYDMETLRPLKGAIILFREPRSNSLWTATTDAAGHYTVDIPKTRIATGVVATIQAPHYRAAQVEDADPPYRSRERAERLAAAAEFSPVDLEPVPVRAGPAEETVLLDLVGFAEPAK